MVARSEGGAYDTGARNDIRDTDCFQDGLTQLSGTTDALASSANKVNTYNYVVTTGSADAITAAAPRAGLDDGLSMAIFSDTAFAHTITFSTACVANGAAALRTVITFAAFRGAGVILRAFNGTWQVVGATGVSFS